MLYCKFNSPNAKPLLLLVKADLFIYLKINKVKQLINFDYKLLNLYYYLLIIKPSLLNPVRNVKERIEPRRTDPPLPELWHKHH